MDLAVLHHWLGDSPETITWWQMSLRGLVIFLFGLLLVRFIARRRAFGRNSAFDIVLAVLIGSNLSRALTANSELIPTLAATAVIVLLHRLLSDAAVHAKPISWFLKSEPLQLVKDGELDRRTMRKAGVGIGDLREAARMRGFDTLSRVGAAFIERNGSISIIPRDTPDES